MKDFDDQLEVTKKHEMVPEQETEATNEQAGGEAVSEEEAVQQEAADEVGFAGSIVQEDSFSNKNRKRNAGFKHGFVTGVAAALCGVGLFCGGWLIGQKQSAVQNAKAKQSGASILTDAATQKKLQELQQLIGQYYLNEIDSEYLSDYLYKGIAAGLDDPYAAYYSSEELTSFLDSSKGEYFGIGAVLSENRQTGELCVVQVYEDTPAEKGGLKSGDLILSLEDEAASALGLSEFVARIKATEEAFHLMVYRPDTGEELELELKCDTVSVSHVEYEMLEDQIGYIRITEFTENAVTQFQDAVESLNQQHMEKLIVDLRSNPGGLLSSVCEILDEILPKGRIVYTEDRDGKETEILADDEQSVMCEIAVLVDGYSASASEIFAGAVQDYELGPVIGTRTYGKGVVQKTYPLSDGAAFKMTVEKYYTAKGQDIEGNGIMPDIVVEAETVAEESESAEAAEQQAEAAESANAAEQQAETAESANAAEQQAETAEQDEVDRVLERALEELRK